MKLSEEIERIRGYGRRYIPQKTGAGFYAQIEDQRLREEQQDEKRRGVCPKCRIVKSKNGECMC